MLKHSTVHPHGGEKIENVDSLDVLGVTFSRTGHTSDHVHNRIAKCRASYYSLAGSGLAYPGLNSEAKAYLWKTICVSSLVYGLDTVPLSRGDANLLSSTQGTLVKSFMGLGKRHHHTKLLRALQIKEVMSVIQNQTLESYHRAVNNHTPVRQLQLELMTKYIASGETIKGTILDKLVTMGCSPLTAALHRPSKSHQNEMEDGIVDSMKQLIQNENYIKPWSHEFALMSLLTRAL